MDRSELAFRIEQAYRRCASFPEMSAQNGTFIVRGDAFLAFIELRNLMPDVMLALAQKNQIRSATTDRIAGKEPNDIATMPTLRRPE